jgi:hypothetical protein
MPRRWWYAKSAGRDLALTRRTRLIGTRHVRELESTLMKGPKAQIATMAAPPTQRRAAVIPKQPIVDSANHVVGPSASDLFQSLRRLVGGVATDEVWESLMRELINLHHPPEAAPEKHIHHLLFQSSVMLAELQPTSALEALLSVQMIGVHRTAMSFIARATVPGQTVEGADLNVLRATRLMRLFAEQIEALSRLKGKSGQQRVVVEHVTVNKGGNAIVGAVSAAKSESRGAPDPDDDK